MSKQAGLGDRLFVDGIDLSGDVGSLGRVGGGPAAVDVTGIDKEAFERLFGLRDGSIEFTGFFNPTGAHPELSALPTADRIMTYCRGTLLGAPAASQVCKQTNYDPTRGNDGSLNLAVSSPSNSYGVDWGEQLTAGQVNHTTPTNGSAVDFNGKGGAGVSTAFGIQAFLHVFALTGTTVTFTIEDSADGSTGWASIGAFTAVTTAPQAQRIQTARDQAVRRFLRVVSSGTFSSVDFAVAVDRNPVAVNF